MSTAPQEGGSPGGPTALRIMIGAQLRRLREAKGITRQEAGYLIRASESKISRLELGRVGFKDRDIADLLTLYGLTDGPERESLLTQAKESNAPGWWRTYVDVTPDWFQNYLGLEASANLIRTYEVQFVPGLLQTEAYARAVVRLAHGHAPDDEVDRRVWLRMGRQQLLDRPHPPTLWAVIDEAALRRPVGGTAVMREQLRALVAATRRPNVRLQILRLAAGGHAAGGGAFSILRFEDQKLPDLVYMEHLTTAAYLDKKDDLDQYADVMNRLAIDADPPDDSVKILQDLLDHYSADQT